MEGQNPRNQCLGIFRSQLPQTAASLDERIAALDLLVAKQEEAAFDLLCGLVDNDFQIVTPAQRPDWREDDVGAGHGVTREELCGMLRAATDRLFSLARGNPMRATRLIELARVPDTAGMKRALACAEAFAAPSVRDEDKEAIRTALRKKLHWHRKYDETAPDALATILRPVEDLYERLLPQDLIVRHRWLFANGRCDLPTPKHADWREDMEELGKWRAGALREIYAERGLLGIEQLAIACPNASWIGYSLITLGLDVADLATWIVERAGDLDPKAPLTATINGLLCGLPVPLSSELVAAVIARGGMSGWGANRIADFLLLAPVCRATWDTVASQGADVEKAYWAKANPLAGPGTSEAAFEFVLDRLLIAGRPRSALLTCGLKVKSMDPNRLAEILEQMLTGQEPDAKLPDSWYMGEAVQRLEAGDAIDGERLTRLEFFLIPLLGHEGEQLAVSLYNSVMSDPQFFTSLLCLVYKPSSGDREEVVSDNMRANAKIAWQVFHHCRRQPGTKPDGTVDPSSFAGFIDEARRLCREADRLGVCDSTLGGILAHAPADADGTWPFKPARDVLDRPDFGDMRHSFQIGCQNKRGVTTRGIEDGGDQERALAEKYRQHARALCHSHPRLAAAMDQLASWYEQDGLREDHDADLRLEGY